MNSGRHRANPPPDLPAEEPGSAFPADPDSTAQLPRLLADQPDAGQPAQQQPAWPPVAPSPHPPAAGHPQAPPGYPPPRPPEPRYEPPRYEQSGYDRAGYDQPRYEQQGQPGYPAPRAPYPPAGFAPGLPEDATQPVPIVTDAELAAAPLAAATPTTDKPGVGNIVKSASTMAIGSLLSRLTGFVRQIMIAAVLGVTLVSDAYNVANTLPNIVYELLLGGALTSVFVPLLVRAQKNEPDGGVVYAQRLLTITTVVLTAATVLAIVMAPLLVWLMGISPGEPNHALASIFAALLLPEIIFYGIGALLGAILNTRGVYAAPAWAPVLNNLVVIAVCVGLIVLGTNPETPDTIGTSQVLLLGIGTTFGIVVQALALWPAMRKVGFRWKWNWRWRGVGLAEVGGLAAWAVGYVAISQVGYTVTTRLANDIPGGYTQYTIAQLLFQMPYGILGVSLLTAIMPRMSRAAADGDIPAVKGFLATGVRLSALALLPISAGLILLGVPLAVLFFAVGNVTEASASGIGVILAASGFGMLPLAIVMLQLRVFYAAKDARTPTLINVGIVVVKVGLSLLCPIVLPDRYLVAGLAVANSLAFVAGVVIGDVWLRRRFGPLGTGALLGSVGKIFAASVLSLVIAVPAFLGVVAVTDGLGKPSLLLQLLLTGLVGVVVYLAFCSLFKVQEVRRLTRTLRRRLPGGRGRRG